MIYQILNNNQKEKKKKLCVGKRSDCVQIVNGQHGLRLVPDRGIQHQTPFFFFFFFFFFTYLYIKGKCASLQCLLVRSIDTVAIVFFFFFSVVGLCFFFFLLNIYMSWHIYCYTNTTNFTIFSQLLTCQFLHVKIK